LDDHAGNGETAMACRPSSTVDHNGTIPDIKLRDLILLQLVLLWSGESVDVTFGVQVFGLSRFCFPARLQAILKNHLQK
jgi:hypothetical protein